MKLITQTPKQALKPFLKQRPTEGERDKFKNNLIALLDRISVIDKQPKDESEEHLKNNIRDFLRDTYYIDTNAINTKDKKDLVIHIGKTTDTDVAVIIEAKRPSNTKEMVSDENVNKKALHELILYYLTERNAKENGQLKHLVITDINQWFIIDVNHFDKHIYRNTQIRKLYETKVNDKKDNPWFYEEIAKIISKTDIEIPCVYFDIRDYEQNIRNAKTDDDKELVSLYKILSPQHLLKIKTPDDNNSLNENFYVELLHIIGLEETKVDSKNIIRRKKSDRVQSSLIELAIQQLITEDVFQNIPDISIYGENKEDRIFNIALELCITWINRVLFLKLLEGQLINYHNGSPDFKFLNYDTIHNFDELFKLFHKVLAEDIPKREKAIQIKYANVPYLNSSLFDYSELERQTIKINTLDNDGILPFIGRTVLKEAKKKSERFLTLEYLFKFLDAYDFSSEGIEDWQKDNKQLISASVLGKVFEKINGYKDGSIFTPAFITMYMCRQSIRLAIVDKFNETLSENGKTKFDKFEDIGNYTRNIYKTSEVLKVNQIVDAIRICDPAVGSGHFLVSALNEIIAIKSELEILADNTGDKLSGYDIDVINDELIITDKKGNPVEYKFENGKPKKEIQRLQKTLFYQKQTIIENCLFGVDINPKSVLICRLRLWIELLKNAYYKEPNYRELETLPNIDINIKCGNSLLSRFDLGADLSKALKSIKYDIKAYRNFVNEYKNEKSRDGKRNLQKIIDSIKADLKTETIKTSKEFLDWKKAKDELDKLTKQFSFFEKTPKEKKKFNEDVKDASDRMKKHEAILDQIRTNVIYKNAFEWRFEFPEVLNNKGDFEGFDLIIGNPPYISNWDLSESNRPLVVFLEKEYSPYLNGHWDLFGCFIYKGVQLLKNNGINTYILPTSFYKEKHSTELRKYFIENVQIKELIDFKEVVIFEGIARQTGIYLIKKGFVDKNEINLKFSIEENGRLIPQSFFSQLKNNAFKANVSDLDISIYNKLLANSVLLGNIVCINTGVVAHSKIDSPIKFTKDDVLHKKFQKGFKKYVVGSNISQYDVIFDNDYIDYESKRDYFHRPKFPMLFESEKIIVRRISGNNNKFLACFDDAGYYTNDNVMHLVLWNKKLLEFQKPEKKWDYIIDSKLSLKYLLAIINSKLNTYYFSKFLSTDTLQGTYSSIYPEDIRQIPIKNISIKHQQPFITLVDKIIALKKQGKNTNEQEEKIDELVYQLYNITPAERKTIAKK